MRTECNLVPFQFPAVESRAVVADFDGGAITSDAGGLLLGATDRAIGMIDRLAGCFVDGRTPHLVEHSVATMLGQRIYGIALGYEDLVDHDRLRCDPVMAVLAGKTEARRDSCKPLAGKSTLNRLECSKGVSTRYSKIHYDAAAIEALFVDIFIESYKSAPTEIILDLDATDDPLHGEQEGRFFHGYYNNYCYMPLYIFCGRHLLVSKLRRSNIDGAAGAREEVARVVAQIRNHWPQVKIILRADSGFARDELMTWCETNGVHYVFGLAKNSRLIKIIASELEDAKAELLKTGEMARRFKDFTYRTQDSWSRERRVVGKAEWIRAGQTEDKTASDKSNPRFVVTTLSVHEFEAQYLYEKLYCARGEMENRIKECQLDLFADRTSAATMKANQLRLWFASLAYVLVSALRRIGLQQTRLAKATCGTIRLQLFKIGALVKTSVRRIKIAMASSCPYREDFARAHAALASAGR
jgi:hypothetical protein